MAASWLQNAIGSIAGTLTTVAFVPQVVKTWRSRSARDISLTMYLAFSAGVALWMLYALMIGSLPILVANGATLVLAGIIIAIKIASRGGP
ncbi:MAG: SemiSWEET transporter [Magnetospirillum sp.]|nr:SemiSWEET transporter [Magnetospirillum sp.]